MESKCSGCLQNLPRKKYLTCAYCKKSYDLECANVPSQRFYNTMTHEVKQNWKCQACYCNTPKTGNADTPIRSRDRAMNDLELNNMTTGNKPATTNNDTLSSEDLSILGDTKTIEDMTIAKMQSEITLENISEIISIQLRENNISIISQLQATIQTEINKAIDKLKEDVTKEINNLSQQNKNQQTDIELMKAKMAKLDNTNKELREEIKDLEAKLTTNQMRKFSPESNSKKIVLFGLSEHYKERESDLHNRINQIFRDIMRVDLVGYIEDTYRIGKYNNRNRPLVIELLSKRMAKYITENSQYFQGTNLSISEFLDENERKARKILREDMFNARRKGLYAVIRNNQLYIEGKKANLREEQNDTRGQTLINTTNDREHIEQQASDKDNDHQKRHTHNYTNNNNNNNNNRFFRK